MALKNKAVFLGYVGQRLLRFPAIGLFRNGAKLCCDIYLAIYNAGESASLLRLVQEVLAMKLLNDNIKLAEQLLLAR